MYVFLRKTEDNKPKDLCFVQAESIEKAKAMVSVPVASDEWLVLPDDMATAIADVKEGYIVKTF